MAIPIRELNLTNAVEYHYDKFPPKKLSYAKILKPLAQATDAVARFDQMLTTLRNTEILLSPLRNQEAVISSRMEGTVSTMDEILRYEADNAENDGVDSNARFEVVETFLYQRALKSAERAMREGQPLTEHMIRSIHQILLSFGRGADKTPGKYKTEQNYIVDGTRRNVLFVPINPQILQNGMTQLLDYIHNDEEQILIRTAIAHLEFEALHPFKDGNGRVGRMLITLMLWSSNVISAPHFYISGYLEERKGEYINLMKNVSKNDAWTDWCVFFLEAVQAQAIRNLETAKKISALYEDMKSVFSEILSSKYSINALDFIFANPVFRTTRFAMRSGIPSGSARRFLPMLAERDVIQVIEPGSGRRAALYRFEPMMELVRV